MTLYQFNVLKEAEQLAILAKLGVAIGERSEATYLITLFQLEGFYAEIWQEASTRDFCKVRSFVSTDQLKPYLERVDISELIKS